MRRTPRLFKGGHEQFFDIALSKNAHSAKDYHWRGLALMRGDSTDHAKLDEAQQCFEKAAELDPKGYEQFLPIRQRQIQKLYEQTPKVTLK